MMGLKRIDTSVVHISGIELAETIRKHQFKIGKLPGKTGNYAWAFGRRSDGLKSENSLAISAASFRRTVRQGSLAPGANTSS